MNLGLSLDSGAVQKGLRELNPEITFDAPVNRPSDYHFLFEPAFDEGRRLQRAERGSVYYKGNFVCAIDRGLIPEFRIWSSKLGVEEIRMADIYKYEDTKVMYAEIRPESEAYNYALTLAERGDDNYMIRGDGKVFRYQALRVTRVRDKVLRAGWRHTFEELLKRAIPGVTRKSLARKFSVDMKPRKSIDFERLIDELDTGLSVESKAHADTSVPAVE